METASIYPQRLRVYNRFNDETLLCNLKKNYNHKETLSIRKPSLYLKRLTYSGPFIYAKSVFCHHCSVASFWLFGHSDGKESACNVKDLGSIPGLGRSLDEGMVPTPVFLPGESHGQRRLEDYSPWGCRVRHNWATNTSLNTWKVIGTAGLQLFNFPKS